MKWNDKLRLDDNLKRAMVTALRALNERVALVGKLRDQAKEVGEPELAESWTMRVEEFEREAGVISEAIRRLDRPRRIDV